MRLGIKGKQVLGVTTIVGAVVVVLSLLHLARAGARQPRREPRARRAAGQRHLPSRARGRRATAPIRTQALRDRSGPALDPRVEPLLEERDLRRDRRRRRHGRRARRSGARRPAAAGRAAISATLLARPPLSQLRAIYSGQGRNLEFAQPLLLGDTEFGSIRIGVSTLLIRQDLDASLRPGAGRPRSSRSASGDRARCCSRSCCCGRFT